MYRPDHATHTASTAHADDRVQFLVVGDETSLVELSAELALLPLCARGRVFVEVEDASQIVPLGTPLRVTLTWLPRSDRSGRPGTGERCARGEAAARAVRAWCDEMLCDGAEEHTTVTLLGGFLGTADIAEHLTERLGLDPARITAPERFRLL